MKIIYFLKCSNMSDSREFYIFWDLNFVPFVLHKNILRMKQFTITFSKIYFSCNFKICHEGKQENLSLKFVKESSIFQNKESTLYYTLTLLQYDDSIFETKLKFEWFKMIFSSLKIQKKNVWENILQWNFFIVVPKSYEQTTVA